MADKTIKVPIGTVVHPHNEKGQQIFCDVKFILDDQGKVEAFIRLPNGKLDFAMIVDTLSEECSVDGASYEFTPASTKYDGVVWSDSYGSVYAD